MRTLSRFLLILLSIVSVGALGYYAYILSFETLSYPFLGTDTLRGNTMEVVLAEPRFTWNFNGGPILDEGALRSSLFFGSAALLMDPTLSGEYKLTVSGEYFKLNVQDLGKGQTIRLDATHYNSIKTTEYRIPRDITLTPFEHPRSLTTESVGLPREKMYAISMYGFESYTPEHIRYYISYGHDTACTPMTSWQNFSQIFPTIRRPMVQDGQIYHMTVSFDYRSDSPYVCILGGVNGVYTVVEDRSLTPFTVIGSVLESLSPEYDMQTRVEFDFSHHLYEDTGALYSPEYIANRKDAKIDFLKHLSVSPDIPLTPENLIFTPDRAILTLPLTEGIETRFSLNHLSDLYGRAVDIDYPVTPRQASFLSLQFAEKRSYYQGSESIPVKIYALKAPKKSYSLKLCHMPLESYSHVERILSDDMTGNTLDTLYSIISGSGVYSCTTKQIDLSGTGYVSKMDLKNFTAERNLTPGNYILGFTNKTDIIDFQKPVVPILFTVMNSHITMKVDASGKTMFLITDISTGKPLANQEITVMRNITRTYHERWNSTTNETDREYTPVTSQAFASGMILGRTNDQGFLDVNVKTLIGGDDFYGGSPYDLSFESWWQYEGRYESFIVTSKSDDHLGYLVSTWNDGITGYNFGMKDSDYSSLARPRYTSYLHTDRKLYLPGETVHFHGVLRENSASLSIPTETTFTLVVSDAQGKEVQRTTLKPNEFGTISTDLILAGNAPLGMYSVSLVTGDQTEYIANGSTNFQVEVFKNPTFTATVDLKSPDIIDESVNGLRKKPNTDPNTPWYSDVYEGNFSLQGVVKAKYYNGAEMHNTPFSYKIYRSPYYGEAYWSDCFWGCYFEPALEYYTEGSGMIDQDGYGVFQVPVAYKSFFDDYKYTAEIIVRDPLSGEEVTTPGSLLVRLPEEFRSFAPDNPLIFTPKKKILQNGEDLQGTLSPEHGSWQKRLEGKYGYDIVYHEYHDVPVDDIRAGKIHITSTTDHIVLSGIFSGSTFSKKIVAYPAGEYVLRTYPLIESGSTLPDAARSEIIFYVAGNMSALQGSTVRVIPEKTIYKPGEIARVLVTVPFPSSHILLTVEKGGVMKHEYFALSGTTFTREYKVDDSLIPNAYIGVVALTATGKSIERSYAVGYGEIIADATEKKANLILTPDKTQYKNRDTVSVDVILTDRSGNPLQGEVAVMVVDESLIRLLGNIDLDILPKFFQKYPFTMKTSLTAIGIEHNRWLSRKGSNGGSGDKGGGGVEIASRTLFQNTAYYNPSIRTDVSGKAKITFSLPDTLTDYRIITVANTRDSHFAVAEKTIEVRKDYVIEAHAPMILRPSDTSVITASVFNATKKITGTTLVLSIGTGTSQIKKTVDLTLNPGASLSRDFSFSVLPEWSGNIPYRLDLFEKTTILDSLSGSFRLAPIPEGESNFRTVLLYTGSTFSYTLPRALSGMDLDRSMVSVTVASSYLPEITTAIRSLVQYPYGCIEQTIGSILPNALALHLDTFGSIGIDQDQARENVKRGLAKILRMQHYNGGWEYWEGDGDANIHITPYVLRSLIALRNLGETIPDTVIEKGAQYILTNLSTYQADPDNLAEALWTLALIGKKTEALSALKDIDTSKLSRHGYLAYAYTAHLLDIYPQTLTFTLDTVLFGSGTTNSETYWYWDTLADMGIYAQLLLDRGEEEKAFALIDRLVRGTDLSSSTLSTQAKIQIFRALLKQLQKTYTPLKNTFPIALRGDALIADASLGPKKQFIQIDASRQKFGGQFTLKRDSAKFPLSVTIITRDRTKSIVDMPAENTFGMSLTRTFELIDESKGVDREGKYLMTSRVDDGIFQKGKLYRVTLKMAVPILQNGAPWNNLALEDFYPGGWRPINSNLKTENSLTRSNLDDWWGYTESRDDRLLAHVDTGYSTKRVYTYFVRPERVGTYLLPPAQTFFMYQPEIHANTNYQKIVVKE